MDFVTGGTGLLGSHLLLRLTEQNRSIRAIYRNAKKVEAVRHLFESIDPENWEKRWNQIEWIEVDILDVQGLDQALIGCADIYHCAGLVSFDPRQFDRVMKINREGTANMVNCCLDLKVRKFCHVSSTAAIGGIPNTITNEETQWKNTPEISGYAHSKYAAEREVWRGIEEGLNAVIVNPSVLFGAGNWDDSSMTIFRTVDKGLPFYTSGQNGFVDARDVADIMVQLMESEISHERYLCVGENVPFQTILTKIAQRLQKKPPYLSTPRWLMGMAWRISWIVARLRGHSPTVTKETTASAFKTMTYDTSKIQHALGYTFRPIDETIDYAVCYRMYTY